MVLAILVCLTIIASGLVFVGASHLIAIFAGAPTVSSPKKVIEEALRLAGAKPGEKFIDLGCGWGKVLVVAEGLGLDASGIDVSPAAVTWNRLLGRKAKMGNLLNLDLGGYDIVYFYLLPKLVGKLSKILETTKPSARIIAIDFPPPSRKPSKVKKIQTHAVYLYK